MTTTITCDSCRLPINDAAIVRYWRFADESAETLPTELHFHQGCLTEILHQLDWVTNA